MGVKHADGQELLRRCEQVGWTYRRTSRGHVMVTTDTGRTATFALHSTEPRAFRNALAQLKRIGLTDAEARVARAQERQRAGRITADRQKAADDTAEIIIGLTNAEARVARAQERQRAGRITADRQKAADDTAEIITHHNGNGAAPAPVQEGEPMPRPQRGVIGEEMTTETVRVDPQWASNALNREMPHVNGVQLLQRPLNPSLVEFYEGCIERGEWFLSPEGVALAPNGSVLDGQHRLWAIFNSGVTLPMRVTYNCPPEAFPTLNTGKTRTGADMLRMAREKNAPLLSSCAKLLHCYLIWEQDPDRASNWQNWNRLRPSNQQMFGVLDEHPTLREHANYAASHARRLCITPSSLGVWSYLAAREWPSKAGQAKIEEFSHQLVTGEMISKGDPALTLRNWLMLRRAEAMFARRERMLLALLKAWNRFAEGKQLQQIKVGDNELMIRPYRPRRGPQPQVS